MNNDFSIINKNSKSNINNVNNTPCMVILPCTVQNKIKNLNSKYKVINSNMFLKTSNALNTFKINKLLETNIYIAMQMKRNGS